MNHWPKSKRLSTGFGILGWLLVIPLGLIALVILFAIIVEGRKAYWDGKVKELCEREDRIKVFHPVELDAEEYEKLLNKRGQIDLRAERLARPEDTFVYTTVTEYIVSGGGGSLQVRKYVYRILKRPEGVVLSEAVSFSRVAGDFLAIDHSSSYSRPRPIKSVAEMTFTRRQ
jgi:hypothetical protein